MLKNNQYTNIADQQILDKTGKLSDDWYALLDDYRAVDKQGKDVCQHLINKLC